MRQPKQGGDSHRDVRDPQKGGGPVEKNRCRRLCLALPPGVLRTMEGSGREHRLCFWGGHCGCLDRGADQLERL